MLRNMSARLARSRRLLATAAAMAMLAASPLARAQSLDAYVPAPPGERAEWRFGPAFGFENGAIGGKDFTAAKLRVELERSMGVLAPKASIGLVLSLAASHPSGSYTVAIPTGFFTFQGYTVTFDANVFEFVAAARINYEISPRLSLFGDGGLGVNHSRARATLPAELATYGIRSAVGDGTGGVLRLAGGAALSPTPQLRLMAELIGLQIRFGEAAETGFGMLLSISHLL